MNKQNSGKGQQRSRASERESHLAARRSVDVEKSISRAMRAIERDVERSNGIYPYSGGRLTAAEVLRRAGLDRAILQKPRHHGLRTAVNVWVEQCQRRLVQGSSSIRKAVTRSVDETSAEIARIRQAWAEAELLYIDQRLELEQLKVRCRQLEQELQQSSSR